MLVNPHLRRIEKAYKPLIQFGGNLQSLFLFYLRLVWGKDLFQMGQERLENLPEAIQYFTSLGITNPTFHAYEVALIEFVCGLFLLFGFASRLAAIPVFFLMAMTLHDAHADYLQPFNFLADPHILSIQHPYPYLLTAAIVFIFGPGRISIDGYIKRCVSQQPRY